MVLGLVGVDDRAVTAAEAVRHQPGALVPLGLGADGRVGQGLPGQALDVEAVELGLVALEQVDVARIAAAAPDVDHVGAALDFLVGQAERHVGQLFQVMRSWL